MAPLRLTLVALLATATIPFAIGVIAERSTGETHSEPATAEIGEPESGHAEAGESGESAEAGHSEQATEEAEDERVLGVDVESTPLIVLAVLVGLGLAAAAATPLGRLRGFLLAVAVIALAWAALDVREAVHQLDESQTAIAVLALLVAALHLAASAVSGRLAGQARAGPT